MKKKYPIKDVHTYIEKIDYYNNGPKFVPKEWFRFAPDKQQNPDQKASPESDEKK